MIHNSSESNCNRRFYTTIIPFYRFIPLTSIAMQAENTISYTFFSFVVKIKFEAYSFGEILLIVD